MDRWIISQEVDLHTGQIIYVGGYKCKATKGDKRSIEWRVTLLDNGDPADISGCSAIAFGNRPDNAAAIASGEIIDNVISVVFTQQFFTFTGETECFLTLTNDSDDTTITVSRIILDVSSGPNDQIVDPGEILPDIAQGLAAIQQLSQYTVSSAAVQDVCSCAKISDKPYLVSYADGTSYTFTADGSVITFT